MSDAIECLGTILSEERGDLFRVRAGAPLDREVLARRAGRLVRYRIRLLPGDTVTIEVSPYDLSRGRITYRGTKPAA